MKVIRDEAYQRYLGLAQSTAWTGARVKDVRDRPLMPGGRTRVTLFERTADDERPHPRLRTEMPPAKDPTTGPLYLFEAPAAAPATAADFVSLLRDALQKHQDYLEGKDLDASAAPKGSESYWRNSIRAQRVSRLFREAGRALDGYASARALAPDQARDARRALREMEDERHAGDLVFDDADTGTYHSFQHDKPFVHYLEAILSTLPEEGSEAFALLSPDQQEAVVRQRTQARNHLDHLMRRKYADRGITETDIERTLGGFLIDRATRHVASELIATRHSLVPAYELLRIDPAADHPHAGAWVYRGEGDRLFLEETGEEVETSTVQVRSIPVEAAKLTFKRAPGDRRLRAGVRFDWDGNGYVSSTPVAWISWAGHCDIKAIMEQLGLALTDRPSLSEYRAETGGTQTFDRDLLIEMLASVFELGSLYRRLDGSGRISRGIHRFGGARNDSLPDRLQLKGTAPGKSFRWPMAGRQDVFRVVKLEKGGNEIALDQAFHRYTADLAKVDFGPNPLYRETVEGDYNIIDVSGSRMEADVKIDEIDPQTGYPVQKRERLVIDLRPGATEQRVYLGTWLKDAARREIWKLTLDRARAVVEAESFQHERKDGAWVARSQGVVWRTELDRALTATLSREMKEDDPSLFQSLINVALREAQNINADTDDKAEVWNGTVTSLGLRKLGANAEARVERWQLSLRARFGSAKMEYLLRRAPDGAVEAFCPIPNQDTWTKAPDFLWQDFPDVGSKGVEAGDWVANATMWDRGIIEVRHTSQVSGGAYVYDEHIKNLYEMIYCALGGLPWTILHNNKRYGFADEASWKAAIAEIEAARHAVRFEGGAIA